MVKFRLGGRLAVGCLIACGGVAPAQAPKSAAPSVQQMLNYKPKQDGVAITTPTDGDLAACKVEVVKGANNASAWVLRDARGQLVRKFADTKGTNRVDTFSYYLDGVEVYREIDTNGNRVPDQFRWFGPGGMRWGVDVNEDGTIDGWQQISAEEVSQEILRAVATRNLARLQALVLSDRELKALNLPPQEANRIRESIGKIPAKFQETCGKLQKLNETAKWQHLETQAPQCVPAEQIGGQIELVRYPSGTILYQVGEKDHDWLQTGEMIQVGRAWRLVGGPTPGHAVSVPASAGGEAANVIDFSDEELKGLIDKLQQLDKMATEAAKTTADSIRYNLDRAAILELIAAKAKSAAAADQWVRQIADCYSAAAQASGPADDVAYKKLASLRERYAASQPRSPLAGYVAFREMSAEYAMKLARPGGKPDELGKIQEGWRLRLKAFVEEYPTAEDAPDALLQLGMVSEFMNKEQDAKGYYALMTKNYANHPLAAKADGALRRLTLDGQVMKLSGPVLGSGQNFDIGAHAGKVVVVYYWASWNQQCAADFIKLQGLAGTYGSKGLEIVCVNLDNSPDAAATFVQKASAPGTHLFQPGALDSPLAVQYGVMVLPNLFLVGKDGKVVSHTVQMNGLEDEIKKLLEK